MHLIHNHIFVHRTVYCNKERRTVPWDVFVWVEKQRRARREGWLASWLYIYVCSRNFIQLHTFIPTLVAWESPLTYMTPICLATTYDRRSDAGRFIDFSQLPTTIFQLSMYLVVCRQLFELKLQLKFSMV